MRSVFANQVAILPSLDTKHSDFAMWVQVGQTEIPHSFQVQTKSESIVGLWVMYQHNSPKSKPVSVNNNVQMYVDATTGRIAGFDIPVRKFHAELRNLIMWLRDQVSLLNGEYNRLNYKIIAAMLHQHCDELFLPPQ